MSKYSYTVMVESADVKLYTVVILPEQTGTFPIILQRVPYVEMMEDIPDEEVIKLVYEMNHGLVEAGYAVIFQHCRGTGKSTGEFIPFIYERQDGLALQAWAREQAFYQEEMYLYGGSYTAAVHLVTAPYAEDIKGVVLMVMTANIYDIFYRNGVCRWGLFGDWYTGMYKKRNQLKKQAKPDSFRMLPMSEYSKTVFREKDEFFDEILRHPDPTDQIWENEWGGAFNRHALDHARVPVLLVAGTFDPFYAGMVQMWRNMDDETKRISSLVIEPYDHSDGALQPIKFENGHFSDQFPDLARRWLEHIRGKGDCPIETGKVSYYSLFENTWRCDDYSSGENSLEVDFGNQDVSYVYDPKNPTGYEGGLTQGFSGTAFQLPAGSHDGMRTFYSEVFKEDQYLRGEMQAKLTVKSDCEDTCFYMRISLVKEEGDYALRDCIQNISGVTPTYVPGTELTIDFQFDYIALKIQKGECLRIDISSSACPHFVPHTNLKGLFSEQTKTVKANNTIVCTKSHLWVPLA